MENLQTNFSPSGLLRDLLQDLREKERTVLSRRYGFETGQKETLESIGKSFSITRERVRQIENAAVRNLKLFEATQERLNIAEEYIRGLLARYGGVMPEDYLLSKALENHPEKNIEKQYLLFILEKLLEEVILKQKETEHLKKLWMLKETSLDALYRLLDVIEKKFEEIKKPLLFEELHNQVKDIDTIREKFNDELSWPILESCLLASHKIKSNPFNEWGLSHWETINPRRMRDKIYLVLKRIGEPLHFTAIAEEINKHNFDNKRAHTATVHNELILDPRFVLVGRGIYALSEWGYKPGIVSDLIAGILKEKGRSMTKQELVEEVLRQRKIKESTILLALSNPDKFIKTKETGEYTLKGI